MPFWRNYYHIVWGTKNRQALITAEIEPVLFNYIRSKAIELDVIIEAIDGWTDHLHIVASIPPKHAVAAVVKRLKGASSHYLNQQPEINEAFKWQRGYGVLTLGQKQLEKAVQYVNDQKRHHRQQTTNYWLEYCEEIEKAGDKNAVAGDRQIPAHKFIRERDAPYYPDEPNFPF